MSLSKAVPTPMSFARCGRPSTKLQKLYLVATYCDEEKQEWHMLMPDELRESLSSNYKFYFDLAEKGQKGPTAKQLRMMAAMKRIMGE